VRRRRKRRRRRFNVGRVFFLSITPAHTGARRRRRRRRFNAD